MGTVEKVVEETHPLFALARHPSFLLQLPQETFAVPATQPDLFQLSGEARRLVRSPFQLPVLFKAKAHRSVGCTCTTPWRRVKVMRERTL